MAIKKLDRAQQTKNLAADRFKGKDDLNVSDINWLVDQLNDAADNQEDIIFPAQEVTLKELIEFDIAGTPDKGDPPTGDAVIIPGELSFRRLTEGGAIFNPLGGDVEYEGGDEPADTVWNSSFVDPALNGFEDLTNVDERVFGNLSEAVDYAFGNNIVGLDMVMKHVPSGRLFKVVFSFWASGGGPGPYGGYTFEIEEIIVTAKKRIRFSDGTEMDTAPVAGENTWNVPNIAFADPINGTDYPDEQGVGDGNKPYKNPAVAAQFADFVICLPGGYGSINLADNKHYHFMPGAILNPGKTVVDSGQDVNCKITGHLVFGPNSRGISLSGFSNLYVECEEFDDVQTVAFKFKEGTCHIKTKRILANCFNGAAYACSPRDGAKMILEVSEYCYFQHWLVAPRGDGTEFIIRCPDMKTLANYTNSYGNTAKCIVNSQYAEEYKVTIDLMGGTYQYEFNGGVQSFGVLESALLLAVNSTTGNGPSFKYMNGTFLTESAGMGIGYYFNFTTGRIDIDNVILRSDVQPIWQRSGATTGQVQWNVNNSAFEGDARVITGNGSKMFFRNCTFRIMGVGQTIWDRDNTGGATADPGETYFMDCYFYLEDTAGTAEFVRGFANVWVVGFLNCYSSEVQELTPSLTDVYGGGGFAVVPALELPSNK